MMDFKRCLCGNPATRECEATAKNVGLQCGRYLCDECECDQHGKKEPKEKKPFYGLENTRSFLGMDLEVSCVYTNDYFMQMLYKMVKEMTEHESFPDIEHHRTYRVMIQFCDVTPPPSKNDIKVISAFNEPPAVDPGPLSVDKVLRAIDVLNRRRQGEEGVS